MQANQITTDASAARKAQGIQKTKGVAYAFPSSSIATKEGFGDSVKGKERVVKSFESKEEARRYAYETMEAIPWHSHTI